MSTKVEQVPMVEPGDIQTTVTSSPAASTSGPKVSMFAAKSGFVIPKNKLSGSLVPVYRGGKKSGGSDAANKESTKQMQRKTKWGPDLTQDAVVRKGRALAYQTRVDQITEQLKSGILEIDDNEESPFVNQGESSGHHINTQKYELLQLERREVIGEILQLNPSYKAPADYKPLLKESKVPIPIKDYPGYNFIGIIFGPASDTQKRLEKETGAKVRVYGIKANKAEKVEITSSDSSDIHNVYEELYVHVSADTYEKVDAAVALIELLVTPVSANPVAASTTSTTVSGNNEDAINMSQGTPTPYPVPPAVVNPGVAQSIVGSVPATPQSQFQPSYPGAWFPTGPPSGFIAPQNPSIFSNPVHASSSSPNPSSIPSLFGPRPLMPAGFGSVPQNPSLVPSRPLHLQNLPRPYQPQSAQLGHTGPARNSPMPALPSALTQPNISAPPPFMSNQPLPTGTLRPLMSALPQSAPLVTFPERPLTPTGSAGWSQSPVSTPASIGLSNLAQMALPMIPPPPGPSPVSSQHIVSGALPLNISAGNMVSPTGLTARLPAPPSSGAASGHPLAAPTSFPLPQVGLSSLSSSVLPMPAPSPTPIPAQSSAMAPIQPTGAQVPVPPSLLKPALGSAPNPSLVVPKPNANPLPQLGIPGSVSATAPTFSPIKPTSVTTLKPQHPNSSDFTFQPHRSQSPASQVIPRPGSQPVSSLTPNLTAQLSQAPQTPFRPAMHNLATPTVMQGFPGPQVGNQMSQPRSQLSDTFAGSSSAPNAPFRHPAFPNPGPITSAAPVLQMGPRNLNPASQMGNLAGPFPPRPGNPVQLQHNYPAMAAQPRSVFASNQQFSSSLPAASGKPATRASAAQQIYDPFSPTSVSPMPQLGGNPAKARKQESDPEYEDLMASVGVK